MGIKVGDRIHYNLNFFKPGSLVRVRDLPVVEVAVYDTGYGVYEEYRTTDGEWVSEMQLVHEA